MFIAIASRNPCLCYKFSKSKEDKLSREGTSFPATTPSRGSPPHRGLRTQKVNLCALSLACTFWSYSMSKPHGPNRNPFLISTVRKSHRGPIFVWKSARFPCGHANLPQCTCFTLIQRGDDSGFLVFLFRFPFLHYSHCIYFWTFRVQSPLEMSKDIC